MTAVLRVLSLLVWLLLLGRVLCTEGRLSANTISHTNTLLQHLRPPADAGVAF